MHSENRSREPESPRPTKLLVVQPDARCDLDRLGRWLRHQSVDVEIVRPFAGDRVPHSVDGDGLIVLGGSMGVLDVEEFPYIADTKDLLRRAVAADVPTLGVCLGAQMLADALGGEVRRGDAGLESGVISVRWVDAAEHDVLTRELATPFLAAALHFDAITRLPAGAVLLGTGDAYPNQVFRVGSAWGVQFHPEITPARYRSWRSAVPEEVRDTHDVNARAFDVADEQVRAGSVELAARFLDLVAESARGGR